MARLSKLGLLLAGCFLLAGCPADKPEEDAGTPFDAGTDAGVDAGEVDSGVVDSGFRCRPGQDDDCNAIGPGLRCDDFTQECIPAKGCNDTTGATDPGDCASFDSNDYCYEFGIGCRCLAQANDAGTAGVCKRRHALCHECQTNRDCGQGGAFDPQGRCVQLENEPANKKFCVQAPPISNRCEEYGGYIAGTQLDAGHVGFCVPQGGSCQQVGCTDDSQCPSPKLCDALPGQVGLCVDGCRWDFKNGLAGELAQPGCPGGKTCWVDAKNLTLDAGRNYGVGRCKDECTSDLDCTDTSQNPNGGPMLRCLGERINGGTSKKRCRPLGCMDDKDPVCPYVLGNVPPYVGYCDKTNFQCRTDCRPTGVDPFTNESFGARDCVPGYKCVPDAGDLSSGVCIQKECMENGAMNACAGGQLCCGADRDLDGSPDPCPATGVHPATKCYTPEVPPYCTRCEDGGSSLCQAYAQGVSALPSVCLEGEYAAYFTQQGPGPSICGFSTHNSKTIVYDAGSDILTAGQFGCPNGYTVKQIHRGCQTDLDCQTETNDAGRCIDDPYRPAFQDGTLQKTCVCNEPGLPGTCPNPSDGGPGSVCSDLENPQQYGAGFDAGLFHACITSAICSPSASFAQLPVASGGCGL